MLGALVAIGEKALRPPSLRLGLEETTMKRLWSMEELDEQWSIRSGERDLLFRKERIGRLGFIAQLTFYRLFARFPEHRNEFAPCVIAHLAEHLGVESATLDEYEWSGRTGRRHRDTILEFLGVRPFDLFAEAEFRLWLMTEALPKEGYWPHPCVQLR